MNDFVARTQPFKILLGILICLGFVAIGLWMTGIFNPPSPSPSPSTDLTIYPAQQSSSRYPEWFTVMMGWVCVALCGWFALKGAMNMTGANEALRINSGGISVPSFSDRLILWSDIADISVWTHRGQKVLTIRLRDPERYPRSQSQRFYDRLNKSLTGGQIGVSMLNTDRKINEAMEAVERFRPKA